MHVETSEGSTPHASGADAPGERTLDARALRGPAAWASVGGVVALAAGVRLWILTTPALQLDGDEAVTGIMARRILDGHHTAYYAGQNYMGSLEQYLQAAVLAVLPDSDFVLRLPQVALAALSCLLVHRISLRCGLSARRALLAAALFAVGPYFLVYWGVKSRGGYAAAMVLALLGLLIALSTRADDGDKVVKAALFGLVAGLAFWINQQAAMVLVPAAWWLWASLRDRPGRHAAAGTAAFLLGSLPALWRTATTGSPLLAAVGGDSDPPDRVDHLFSETLPDYLGVRDDGEWLLRWLPPGLIVAIAVLGLVVAAVRRRHGIVAILALRSGERDGRDLLLLVLCAVPLIAVASGASTNATARFLFVTYPVVLMLLAAMPVPSTVRRTPVPWVGAALVVCALALHTWVGTRWLIAEDDGGRPVLLGQPVISDDVDAVVHELGDLGAATAYADYWLAQPLTWEADGDVLVASVYQRRFPHLTAAAEADPSPALVVSADEVGPLRELLDDEDIEYRTTEVVGWWIFFDITPGVHPAFGPTIAHGLVAAG